MKFFDELKGFIISEEVNNLKKLVPYYETLLQKKDNIQVLIDDYEKYQCDIRYEKDVKGGYTNGKLIIHLFEDGNENYGYSIGHHYEIELLHDERYWGYCECDGECSGEGCDWVAPEFSLTKVSTVARESFDGYERDIWELMESWSEYLQKHKEEENRVKLEQLNKRIEELTKQKEALSNT